MKENVVVLVEEAMKDAAFVQKLAEQETPEAVQKVFAEKGIEFTLDEVKEIGKGLAAMDSDELSEESLENVAGGLVITGITTVAVIKTIGACASLAVAIGGAIKAGW